MKAVKGRLSRGKSFVSVLLQINISRHWRSSHTHLYSVLNEKVFFPRIVKFWIIPPVSESSQFFFWSHSHHNLQVEMYNQDESRWWLEDLQWIFHTTFLLVLRYHKRNWNFFLMVCVHVLLLCVLRSISYICVSLLSEPLTAPTWRTTTAWRSEWPTSTTWAAKPCSTATLNWVGSQISVCFKQRTSPSCLLHTQ